MKGERSALKANEQFTNYLSAYSIRPSLVPPLLHNMNRAFDNHNDNACEQQKALDVKLLEMDKKIEELEEDYYVAVPYSASGDYSQRILY